jgi:hypothetical protein
LTPPFSNEFCFGEQQSAISDENAAPMVPCETMRIQVGEYVLRLRRRVLSDASNNTEIKNHLASAVATKNDVGECVLRLRPTHQTKNDWQNREKLRAALSAARVR